MLASILDFLGTVAAGGIGAWVAAKVALSQWRAEMVGRRRAELAERTLADIYQLKSILEQLPGRLAFAFTEEDRQPILMDVWASANKMSAEAHRFRAVFGNAPAEFYQNLDSVVYRTMIELREERDKPLRNALRVELPSGAQAAVDSLVGAAEMVCRPAIRKRSVSSGL